MKTKLIIIGLAAVIRVQADTNFFEILTCGDTTYTNATIGHVTPSYATVTFAGGIVQVPLRDLPENLQQQYHYNSNAAAQFLLEKKHKSDELRAKTAAQQIAYEKAMAAMAGQSKNIQITSIIDETSNGGYPLCSVGSGGGGGSPARILLRNMPVEVREFLRRYNQLRNDILTFGEKVHNDAKAARRADALAPVSAGGDPAYVNSAMAQRNQANQMALNASDEADRLQQMQDDLEQMASKAVEKTTIVAYPTGQTFGGYEIWTCTGMAPQNSTSP
jgi:hypothetical protein